MRINDLLIKSEHVSKTATTIVDDLQFIKTVPLQVKLVQLLYVLYIFPREDFMKDEEKVTNRSEIRYLRFIFTMM